MSFDPVESLATMRHEFGEHGGVNMSIEASTTFTVMDPKMMPDLFEGRLGPDSGGYYLYGRHFNPTVYVLGHELAAIEGTESGYATASGLSAIAATLLQLCSPGDRIVSSKTIYGGTFAMMHDYFPERTGHHTTFVDVTDFDAVGRALSDGAKVLYCETMSNPTLMVPDIPRLAELAHGHGAKLVVDNTFSPMIVSPAQHGADVVVHSLTKFISGASDIIGGAICASQEFIRSLTDVHRGSLMLLGPTMDPRVAFEISLRLPHLGIRVAEHSRRALLFATRLRERGIDVIYPGLEDHPHHGTLTRIMNQGYGYGGLFGIDLGTTERANELMQTLQNTEHFGYMAVSLGYFDTLMSCSAVSTSSELSQEDQRKAGIAPGLVRISIGYTGSVEQRWNQLADALDRVGL